MRWKGETELREYGKGQGLCDITWTQARNYCQGLGPSKAGDVLSPVSELLWIEREKQMIVCILLYSYLKSLSVCFFVLMTMIMIT